MKVRNILSTRLVLPFAFLLASCVASDPAPCEGDDCKEPCVGDDCEEPCVGDDCEEPCVGDDCPSPPEWEGCSVVSPPALTTVSGANCNESWADHLEVGDTFRSVTVNNASGSSSSPRAFDINNDGCADIIVGAVGDPRSPFLAIDGRSNQIIWQRAAAGEIFGSPVPMRTLNGTLQLLFAGRDGTFIAVAANNGSTLWEADISCFLTGEHETPKNFYNPIVVEDLTDDGVGEIVVIYGGDPLIDAYGDRPASFVLLIDGATGEILASRETPDQAESYTSVTRVTAPGCSAGDIPETTFLIGTGGETHQGELYHLALRDLVGHNWCRGVGEREPWGTAIASGDNQRGFIGPATHFDFSGDGANDILIASAGGGLHALDGADFRELWHHAYPGEETTSTPAVARQSDGTRVAGWGTVVGEYPYYTASVLRIVDTHTGAILEEREDEATYVSSVLAADLDGDGNDELLFTIGSFFSDHNGTLAIYDVAREAWEDRPLPVHTYGTPLIRRYGAGLELIVIGRETQGDGRPTRIARVILSKRGTSTITWPEYLGDCHDGSSGCVSPWRCEGPACNDAIEEDSEHACLEQWRTHIGDDDAWMKPSAASAEGIGRALSAPRAYDVNNDGCRDFVFGVGWEDDDVPAAHDAFGKVIAIDALTSQQLWEVPTRGEVFGSAVELRDEHDDTLLVFAGRDGTLVAIDPASGTPRWTFDASCFVDGDLHLGFYNPIVVEDVNGDGVEELVTIHGGDPIYGPGEIRPHSHVVIISGADGTLLGARPTPDGAESYNAPALVRRAATHKSGAPGSSFTFGTGGETRPGALFLAHVGDLLDYNACTSEDDDAVVEWGEPLIARTTAKGIIAPPIVVDTNGDGILDIVAQYFDGTVARVLGVIGGGFGPAISYNPAPLGHESNHSPALLYDAEGNVHLAFAHNQGVFPAYTNSLFNILSGALADHLSHPSAGHGFSAGPIAGDIDGDGADEAIFSATRYMPGNESSTLIFRPLSGEPRTHVISGEIIGASPLLFQAEGHAKGELVTVGFYYDEDGVIRWRLQRRSLNHEIPSRPTWPQYQGPCANGQARCF